MNPTSNNYRVYRRFVENTHKEMIYDDIPVQISTHPNVLYIHTAYLDNPENLSQEFINKAEDMKANNPEKYAHTVMGRWAGVTEGAVSKHAGVVKEFPKWCRKVAIGLSFGYTNDVSAAMMYGMIDDNLYVDELFYRTNMLSSDLIRALHRYETRASSDSTDPCLMQGIRNGGVKIYPVEKGTDSIIAEIDKTEPLNIFVTEKSYNLRKEFLNYARDKDKDGNYINQPIDALNHGIDATRYWVLATLLGKMQKPKSDIIAAFTR